MKNATKAGRFLKLVEWSDEDGCFVGSAPPLIGPCCHGDNEIKVYQQLSEIVDEWVETLEKDGKPLPEATAGKTYSGKFLLRVKPELHKALAVRAAQADQSLNNYLVGLLEEKAVTRGKIRSLSGSKKREQQPAVRKAKPRAR
jgi:predicted HicB family RNase H-like nuclease